MAKKLQGKRDTKGEVIVGEVLRRRFPQFMFEHNEEEMNDFDFGVIASNEIKAFIEIKCRDNSSTKYPDVFLAERKIDKLLVLTEVFDTATPCFVWAFDDGKVYGVNIHKVRHLPRKYMDRKKARASGLVGANDKEIGVYVDVKMMSLIGEMTSDERKRYIAR